MGCQHIKVGDVSAIVCGPTKRCKCGRRATRLCDFKVPVLVSGTCDAPLCGQCAVVPAPGKDLCKAHAEVMKSMRDVDG